MPTDALSPVAGDPVQVYAAGRTLSSIAAEIADAAGRLRALAQANNTSDGVTWTGQAAVKAYARTITLPPKLDKAQKSYAEAGGALTDYAAKLAQAQADSAAAIRTATTAQADLTHATAAKAAAAVSDAQQTAAAVAAGQPPPAPTAPRYDATIEAAQSQISRARAANVAAHEQQNSAARRAASALKQASHDGIANKHWWQKAISNVTHWADIAWSDSLRFVSTTAAALSALAGLAGLVVGIAGVFCPALEVVAGALLTASAALASIAAVADVLLVATGKQKWTTLSWDALAVIPGGGGDVVRELRPEVQGARTIGEVTRTARVANVDRAMLGKPRPPIEPTLDLALNKDLYLQEVAQRYGINLRGSGQPIEVVYNAELAYSMMGITKQSEHGRIIQVGPSALDEGEAAVANTIAHELSHARYFLRHGTFEGQLHGDADSVGDGTPYGSGNALQTWIEGHR